jgi:enolase
MPTVEADVVFSDGSVGRAAVPSGASTGIHEALELRDASEKRLGGKGVRTAVSHINTSIKDVCVGKSFEQQTVDETLIALDGTPNKSRLGANSILAVSLAFARASAVSQKRKLWEYFRSLSTTAPKEWLMPVPMMNVLNGGKHADKSSDIQEYMIIPVGAHSFSQAMEMGVSVFMQLKKVLASEGFATTVGDEGGFAPSLPSNKQPLEKLMKAITNAGYTPGKDICLAIDAAASEFYENNAYNLSCEKKVYTPSELIDVYAGWVREYPVISVEDVLEQDAWGDWSMLTSTLGGNVQIVGDDLFVTNVNRLQKGIAEKAANAILIKLNQIGTVTETVAAIDLARKNGWNAIVSHRSGETEDTTISDFVVGLGTGQIKTGSLSRSERIAKYNQLLRIEEELGSSAIYAGAGVFPKH